MKLLKITITVLLVLAAMALLFAILRPSLSTETPSAIETPAPLVEKSEVSSDTVLITAALTAPKGLDVFAAQEFLTKNGMNLFSFSQDWKDMEPAPGHFELKDSFVNPMTLVVEKYPFEGTVFVLKMIDTSVRTMPEDLEKKSFGDPAVRERFLALLHAIVEEESAKGLTHILLGNEVDAYFRANPKELPGFVTLMKESIDLIHREMPGVKVGTITTFDALQEPDIFEDLIRYSDFVNYTYYPVNGLSGGNIAKGWQMRPLSEVPNDLKSMAKGAGEKPFSFTEIGYSASPINNSSEDLQSKFVETVFETLDPYRKEGNIEFISWSSFADYSPDFCAGYARTQRIEASKEFCAFLENLGLRTNDNKERKAWNTFVQRVGEWVR